MSPGASNRNPRISGQETSTVPSPFTVGVIANPASGRDIRRLTTYASVFPTAE
ncbi:MAG: Acetoin catabolism protein X, possible NAD kinase [uncultured Paraburkholderia sp.]|nr:MAG: Acetoin catabolism protein X, possible NAD kinase [uncultured Paraburkholderia sp.]CAH2938801.1 MAG: Acetoin catabolism protein X, possible NAD kinase [uncultured Paraburkholderia sp.]